MTTRTCQMCGAEVGPDRPDACLGKLPGVIDACCGHGRKTRAYIVFKSGLIIRGFGIQKRTNKWGKRVDSS
jgi:hypothetical protein